jgi:hypothetical protein
MAYEDTLRLILQNAYDRKENLVQINTQATLAIPTIIVAIWGIDGGLNNFRNAWILSIISIGLISIWRYFAHYIDNDIARIYIEIVKAENRLGVPADLSFFNNFIRSLKKNQTKLEIDDNKKVKLLVDLCKNNLMGFRGHNKWDILALLLIDISLTISLHGFLGILIIIIIVSLICYTLFVPYLSIQRDPTESEFNECLNIVKKA